MTSLFRRSNGASRGDSDSAQLNNSRPPRQVRRLEFNQAMDNFKTMFPSMDYEVIECVLRANNGAVDSTIDQLLQMSVDEQASDDSSDSDDSIPPEILERTLEPDSSDEEPPPVYAPPTYDMHIYDRKYPEAPPSPPPRFEAQPPPGHQLVRSFRDWNPPLLGNLPDDFLRILPQQLDSVQSSQSSLSLMSSSSSSSSLSTLAQQVALGGGPGTVAAGTEQERKLKQYLEDERIALFLQNEEFMKELQRNREFLIALERDRLKFESKNSKPDHSSASVENSTAGEHCASGSGEACIPVSDDALFRDKLKHMGKSTRKKLFEIARAFSEKTRRKKTKRKSGLKNQSYPSDRGLFTHFGPSPMEIFLSDFMSFQDSLYPRTMSRGYYGSVIVMTHPPPPRPYRFLRRVSSGDGVLRKRRSPAKKHRHGEWPQCSQGLATPSSIHSLQEFHVGSGTTFGNDSSCSTQTSQPQAC